MTAIKPAKSTKPGAKKAKNYSELEAEIQAIINWFESDNFDVDQAVRKYERGLELVSELEKYLAGAENTVRQLKVQFKPQTK